MNRLTLAQSLREKCGITGSGPSTTLSQTGEMLRVVNWIDEAWLQIQTLSDWWQWMRADFSFDTIAAQREYVPSASPLSLTNFARWYTDPDHTWRAYLLSAGKSTEQFLVEEPNYQVYRDTYLFGSEQSGPPRVYSINPVNKAISLAPLVDGIYRVYGSYQKGPVAMTADADIPGLPTRFHMLIVYRAMMLYAAYEAAPEVQQEAVGNYKSMLSRLKRDQLPAFTIGGPLVE